MPCYLLKNIKNLLVNKPYQPIAWMTTILCLSIIPLNRLPKIEFELFSIDKAVHAFFYASLTYLWWKYWSNLPAITLIQKIIYSLLITIVYGLFIEFLQEYAVTNRHFELADVIANTFGCCMANAVLWLQYRRTTLQN